MTLMPDGIFSRDSAALGSCTTEAAADPCRRGHHAAGHEDVPWSGPSIDPSSVGWWSSAAGGPVQILQGVHFERLVLRFDSLLIRMPSTRRASCSSDSARSSVARASPAPVERCAGSRTARCRWSERQPPRGSRRCRISAAANTIACAPRSSPGAGDLQLFGCGDVVVHQERRRRLDAGVGDDGAYSSPMAGSMSGLVALDVEQHRSRASPPPRQVDRVPVSSVGFMAARAPCRRRCVDRRRRSAGGSSRRGDREAPKAEPRRADTHVRCVGLPSMSASGSQGAISKHIGG